MTLDSSLLKSYLKTTLACLASTVVAAALAGVALRWFPGVLGPLVGTFCAVGAVVAAGLACGGCLAIWRCRRAARGERDLFLELNRSREPAAIEGLAWRRTTRIRRWLGRRALGHDLVVGDLVEVKAWDDIRATLDERGCLDQLPFMPEMLSMCGRRAHVFRCVHRLFDYRKTRRMRHLEGSVLLVGSICDGSEHGGCEAACHMIWKAAWLRRVDQREGAAFRAADHAGSTTHVPMLDLGTRPPYYACQLTALHHASRPINEWSVVNLFRPLVAGNVTLGAFVVGWLTHLFNKLQYWRGGVSFPAFGAAEDDRGPETTGVEVGTHVVVRSPAQIRATLNDQLMHRGMWFEPDMLKHCGRRYCVRAEVRQLVDIVTGEMRTMKTPAYILDDVHFSGERQLFNAQYEPLFWRAAWLQPEGQQPDGG